MRLYLDTVNLEKKNLSKNHTAWANFKEFNSLVRCLVHQVSLAFLKSYFLIRHQCLVAPPLLRNVSKAAVVECVTCPTFHASFFRSNESIIRVVDVRTPHSLYLYNKMA